MHRLHRDPAPPAGLGHYRHGQHAWSNTCPTPDERKAIWDKLDAMQGERCAYCEGPMGIGNRHIEHFRQRDRYRHLVAVGESAYAAARQAFPQARVWPILLQERPAGADRGLSRFVAPVLVVAELHTLSPAIETLVFVYRATVPDAVVQQAQAAAQARGLAWEAIAVDDLRAAARAIERVRQQATPTRAVWLHRDVLALNPDILIPPLVRRSWEIGFPVISDDADSVERGLLLALTPDYRALGRALAAWPTQEPAPGWRDIDTVRRVLNRRTARAIGAARHPAEETHFDVIFD